MSEQRFHDRKMTVLGIETSCDETAAAVVVRHADGRGEIVSNVVRSQLEEHAQFGGVVPELAARAHAVHLDDVVRAALEQADMDLRDLDGIGATAGPGLIGGVLAGLTYGKALSFAAEKPFVGVNHLEGHALTPRLTDHVEFPYLLLLVSGGHTQYLHVRGVGQYERLGGTIDDALGEAFDKVAKLLGLGYPGGPEVEKLARAGDHGRFDFPRPLLNQDNLDFSFSGLKTAVRLAAEKLEPVSADDVCDICASFQRTVGDILVQRTRKALERVRSLEPEEAALRLVIAGGVAANQYLADRLQSVVDDEGAELSVPPLRLCTDNGAMIAWAAAERLALGQVDGLDKEAKPRWPLDAEDMIMRTVNGGAHG